MGEPNTEQEILELVERRLQKSAPKAVEKLRDLAKNAVDPGVKEDAREYLGSEGIPLDPEEGDADTPG